jgi:hypothetical protein
MKAVLIPVLAWVLSTAPSPQQNPCDLKNVHDGYYCEKCKKALREDELVEKEYCKVCGAGQKAEAAKCVKVKVCDKEWVRECGMHKQKPHPKPCCPSKMCCKIEHDLALVEFKCAKCGAKARSEAEIKHACKGEKIEMVCSKSGTLPHGGEWPQ